MTGISPGWPYSQTMPIGRRSALAPPKVAPEMTVCIRFCRGRLRKPEQIDSGMRETAMALTAPMTEVFGAIPTRVSAPCSSPGTFTIRI